LAGQFFESFLGSRQGVGIRRIKSVPTVARIIHYDLDCHAMLLSKLETPRFSCNWQPFVMVPLEPVDFLALLSGPKGSKVSIRSGQRMISPHESLRAQGRR